MDPFVLDIDVWTVIGLTALGLVVGFMAGLFGVGGGFLLTPMLNVLFGVPYDLAVGSTLIQISAMSWVGTRQHFKLGHVDMKLGLAMLAGSFFGAETGVRIQRSLHGLGEIEIAGRTVSGFEFSMAFIFVALLVSVGWAMLVETSGRRKEARAEAGRRAESGANATQAAGSQARGEQAAASEAPDDELRAQVGHDLRSGEPRENALSRWLGSVRSKPLFTLSTDGSRTMSVWVAAGVGFSVSILTGLLGVGGGFVNMPVLIYVLHIPTVVAVGTSSLITSLVSVYSGLRYLMLGSVLWPLVGCLLAGSVIGVRTGAKVSEGIATASLRRYFAYLVIGTAAIVAADAVRTMFM